MAASPLYRPVPILLAITRELRDLKGRPRLRDRSQVYELLDAAHRNMYRRAIRGGLPSRQAAQFLTREEFPSPKIKVPGGTKKPLRPALANSAPSRSPMISVYSTFSLYISACLAGDEQWNSFHFFRAVSIERTMPDLNFSALKSVVTVFRASAPRRFARSLSRINCHANMRSSAGSSERNPLTPLRMGEVG